MNKLFAIAATLGALVASQISYAADAPAAKAEAKPVAAVPAAAGGDCEAKAIDKNGKPLHGAAKAAKMKKCVADGGTAPAAAAPAAANASCAEKAVGKNGKPLAGAAKGTFMKKCEADAKK